MPTLSLGSLTFETAIYPREQWKTATVNRYVDCLKRGDQFPPLIVEAGTTRLLDGVHRWKAYQKYHALYLERMEQPRRTDTEYDQPDQWAAPVVDITVEYHQIPEGIPAKLYCAALSITHGDRVSAGERKALAQEIYEANPDFRLADLEAYLHISTSTAGEYVGHIRARRREAQKIIAYRLHRLGWTQEEIAEQVGITRDQYTRGFLCAFPDLEKDTKKLLASNIPHLDVAERFTLPLILTHAIDLHGRDDQERCKRLDITIQPYDVWNFAKCDDLHPIIVSTANVLIVGRRRLAACAQLGWTRIPAQVLDFDDPLSAEHDENVMRKDFSPSEAVAIGEVIEERIRKEAKERQAQAGGKGNAKQTNGSEKFTEPFNGSTRDVAAAAVGWSGPTYEKAKAVVHAARQSTDCAEFVKEMDQTGKRAKTGKNSVFVGGFGGSFSAAVERQLRLEPRCGASGRPDPRP